LLLETVRWLNCREPAKRARSLAKNRSGQSINSVPWGVIKEMGSFDAVCIFGPLFELGSL